MIRKYFSANGTILLVCKQYCRIIPNFGGGHVCVDITRQQAKEILTQLHAFRKIQSL